jgi:hypothetical protein
MYDLVIRGGLLIDGTGEPGRLADIGITGDLIVAVAPPNTLSDAHRILDAEGLLVTPPKFSDSNSPSLRQIKNNFQRSPGASTGKPILRTDSKSRKS